MLTGLLAVGIVLVYKSNRFLNLAHAQLGALSAQLLAKLVIDWGWSWWVAFGVCVPVGIVVGLVVERWVVRPLRERSASAVSLLLVTIGVTQVLLALALGAAAVGAFTSLPGALAGGLLIGVSYQIALAATSNAGTAELVVFLVILGIVLVRGGAIGRVFSTAGAIVEDRAPLRIPAAIRDRLSVRYTPRAALAGALVLGLLIPFVPIFSSEGTRFDLALVMLYAVVSLSLTVALGWACPVRLGQFALVGCGAFVAGHLMPSGWSVLFLLVVCGVVGAAVMAPVAMPALPVPGLTLAAATLRLSR